MVLRQPPTGSEPAGGLPNPSVSRAIEREPGCDPLGELRAAISGCRACAQAGYFIDGPPLLRIGPCPAPVFVLGQAPALVHARNPDNPPFSPGRHGQPSPLWKWIEQASLPEQEFRALAYMTAVTRCYPGPARSGGGDRRPSTAEQRLCRPFWTRELVLVRPQLIISLGTMALEALGVRSRLDEAVGQLLAVTTPDERTLPLIPLPHPSGVSRWLNAPANRAQLDRGLALLAEHRPAILAAAQAIGLPVAVTDTI